MKFEMTARTDIRSKKGCNVIMKRGEKFTMDNGRTDNVKPTEDQVKAVVTALYGAEPDFGWCNGPDTYFDIKCLYKN